MTRKRYIKLLMANGWSRNNAENTTGIGINELKPNRSSKTFDERFWKEIVSHHGCWPYNTYVKAYDNMMVLRKLYPSDKPGEGIRDVF